MFWSNLALVAGMLALLGACGWWAVAPFRRHFPFALAQAPLAGMLLLPMSVLGILVVLRLPFDRAVILASLMLAAGSAVSILRERDGAARQSAFLAGVAAITSAAAVWFVTRTDLYFGAPALDFSHGTDHLGYAHIADWLRQSPARVVTPTPSDWYESWPELIVSADPRAGSFALLGIVSAVSARSGSFAYDLCSAVVLSAAALGVPAVVARRRSTYLTLALALFTGYWFDWNRGGYLGKTTGYPGTFLVLGLLLAWMDDARREHQASLFAPAILVALTASASIMFSGYVTALLLALGGAAYITFLWLAGETSSAVHGRTHVSNLVVMVPMLAAVAIISGGTIARPLIAPENIPIPWTWWDVLSRAAELEGLIGGRTPFAPSVISALSAATLAAGLLLLGVAIRTRTFAAAALLAAPLLMLAVLVPFGLKWHAMNFIGSYVPLWLCGAVMVFESSAAPDRHRVLRYAVGALIVALVLLRLPRFESTVRFHGGADMPPLFRFSSLEADALAHTIAREGGSAVVDMDKDGAPHFPVFLLVELGRRKVPLQWSPGAWHFILWYRRWPAPTYDTPAPLRIQMRGKAKADEKPILQTTQFEVVRNP
jgi:hypothetical protein